MIDASYYPLIFGGLLALAVLVYGILDGYDLGVGLLLLQGDEAQRDTMIASIGPFWDANETWLVLAVGILLIAFPDAYNQILHALYLPATIMLIGLILRGVAFDFRAKVALSQKHRWDRVFSVGSLITSLTQGYMLGMYIMGFEQSASAIGFALLSALGVSAAYGFIGACWLVMKTDGDLQHRAVYWARRFGWISFIGIIGVCVVNPLVNERVFQKWFSFPSALVFFHIPLLCVLLFVVVDRLLKRMPLPGDDLSWLPFVGAASIFIIAFEGLAYSFYPYVIPGTLTLDEAISAPEGLDFIFYGVVVVVPIILLYTLLAYRIFWGKAKDLRYY